MKKIITAILVLVCVAAFLPAAFAGDTENRRPWFQPTLRFGYAYDPEPVHYEFSTSPTFLGVGNVDLEVDSVTRPYYALELPFYLTDRLTVSFSGDWSYTSSDSLDASTEYDNGSGVTIVERDYDTNDYAEWVSVEGLVSFAFIKDFSFVKDVSAIAGVRYDYFRMKLDDPRGILTADTDWARFRTQTLMPVFGLSGTFKTFEKGIWRADIHLSALYGTMEWGCGDVDYRETINDVNILKYRGDMDDEGYIVEFFGEVTILSGKITPWMEGSVALFTQFTWTEMSGEVSLKDYSQPFVRAREFNFEGDGTVGVFGLSVALAF